MSRLAGKARLLNALVLLLLAVSLGSNVTAMTKKKRAATTPAPPPYRITAIKAMLYYEQTGTFSRDILAKPEMGLWNTIIGEGEAGSPSSSTMVVVEVTGKKDGEIPQPYRKVELTATSGGKVLLKRAIDIGLLEEVGKFYAGYWLYDTGCGHIKLSARIIGKTPASSMTKVIPFECGE